MDSDIITGNIYVMNDNLCCPTGGLQGKSIEKFLIMYFLITNC